MRRGPENFSVTIGSLGTWITAGERVIIIILLVSLNGI